MAAQTQCVHISANESDFKLTVMQVPDEQRLNFWPLHFGAIPQ